jgi:hypothetical protein
MNGIGHSLLSRRRFLYLSILALAAPTVGTRSAWAADETWFQNFVETDLWNRARGGRSVARAPQWSYFKVLGPQDGSRFPVEHPVTKEKVYIEANTVGASGPPPTGWVFGGAQPGADAAAAPAPAPAGAAAPTPAPAQGAAQSAWVASYMPASLWTTPESGGILLGVADSGSYFQVLEPQKGPRIKVQDPITSGLAYVEAKSVGPVGGPPATPWVPTRWWGYVGGDEINVRAEPTGNSPILGTLPKGTPVVVESWVSGEEVIPDQPGWAKLSEGVYVYGPLLRKAQIQTPPPPPSHGPLADRWIDVNLTQQTVTAYEGDRPVYMTITSSGRPGWETHQGIHQILWRKERETMDSSTLLGQDAARADYKIENIRWTQYFSNDGQAIHENFWRDPSLFGVPSSHGCLGMAAQDALWFWLWASQGTPLSIHF